MTRKGYKQTEEHIRKSREGNIGRKNKTESNKKRSQTLMGHEVSNETRQKLRDANIGKHPSDETRAKQSLSSMGRPAWNKGLTAETDLRVKASAQKRTGMTRSEETKNKISISTKGKTWDEKYGKERADELRVNVVKLHTGKKRTDKTRKNISMAKSGENCTPETRRKMRDSHTGKKQSIETIKKRSLALKGKASWNKGKKYPPETRKKQRISRIEYIEKTKGPMYPTIGMLEKQIIDEIERVFGCVMLRQYRVCGYFVDGYIPEKKVVIEVDEPHHFKRDGNYTVRDICRQKEIEKELGCRFIRIII